MNQEYNPSCFFCGATVGEISQRTELIVAAVYDCEKCRADFCDQCSYTQKDNPELQRCFKCNSVMEKIS